MEDEDLAKYLPSFGDRLAVKNFCRNRTALQSHKKGLFEKLRQKQNEMKAEENRKQKNEEPADTSASTSNKRRKASHRKIEIGWLHCEGGEMKQIRAKQGGGTRIVPIAVECGMDEVLQKGKKLFFPDGMSSKGHESEFNFELRDYKQNPVQQDVSIRFIYDTLCMNRLRFYVVTTAKKYVSTTDDMRKRVVITIEDEDEEVTFGPGGPDDDNDGDDTLPYEFVLELQPCSSSSLLVMDAPPDELLSTSPGQLLSTSPDQQLSTSPDQQLSTSPDQQLSTSPDQLLSTSPDQQLSTSPQEQLSTSPHQLLSTSPQASVRKVIYIHHGNCLNELIQEFMDPAVLTQQLSFRRILPDNSVEMGIGDGVMRDVYTAFWEEFYDRCTVGTTAKVPFIRHDFNPDTWRAIGRILLSGFQTCQYLPIKLALPLMEDLFHGSVCSDILKSFMHYVSSQDTVILKTALEDFSKVDSTDLMDVLQAYECRKMVNAHTLPQVLEEIAHKELIQKPRYVVDCWKEVTRGKISIDKLLAHYEALKPTPRRVQGLLEFEEVTTSKRCEVENHLRRYLRELDDDHLGKFLRFTTGSDLIICSKIKVIFTKMSYLSGRPIGHTCGCVLELPESYDNFPQFRSEFNKVLESNIWVMDIV
ncbi:hypothetical protein ACEWY4_027962 [Coilia grayii]|uniref:HECT domain-containing protein n=1 Tax=Coilia grayii TaxID=363190 RepID=A0ABD1IP97_9TELE